MGNFPPSPIPEIYKSPVQRRPATPRLPAIPRHSITIPRKSVGFVADGKLHVVLDANIVIGALPTQNGIQLSRDEVSCKKIIEVWKGGGFELGINAMLMDEYRRVGERMITERKLVSKPFNELMEIIQKNAYCFQMVVTKRHIARSYKDDHLFDGMQAEYLVSDDDGVTRQKIGSVQQKNYQRILGSTEFVAELVRLNLVKF